MVETVHSEIAFRIFRTLLKFTIVPVPEHYKVAKFTTTVSVLVVTYKVEVVIKRKLLNKTRCLTKRTMFSFVSVE